MKRREAKMLALAVALAAGVAAGPPAAGSVGSGLAQATGDSPGQAVSGVDASTGGQVYREICQACHMPNAEGGMGAGAIPALARNAHLADPDFVARTLIRGRGGMPAFAGMLEPAQIAGVATYIRTHFGNDYPKPVTVGDVRRLSPEDAGGS